MSPLRELESGSWSVSKSVPRMTPPLAWLTPHMPLWLIHLKWLDKQLPNNPSSCVFPLNAHVNPYGGCERDCLSGVDLVVRTPSLCCPANSPTTTIIYEFSLKSRLMPRQVLDTYMEVPTGVDRRIRRFSTRYRTTSAPPATVSVNGSPGIRLGAASLLFSREVMSVELGWLSILASAEAQKVI